MAADGKRLAFSDKDGKLFVLTLDDKKVTQIAKDPLETCAITPGRVMRPSRFTMSNPNGFSSIYIWSVADGQVHRIITDLFDAGDPAWILMQLPLLCFRHDFQPRSARSNSTTRPTAASASLRSRCARTPRIRSHGERRSHNSQRRRKSANRQTKAEDKKTKRKMRRRSKNPRSTFESISMDSPAALPACDRR